MKAAFIALFFILAVLALGAFAEGEGAIYTYKLSLTKKLEDTVLDNDDHFFGLNSGKALTALRAVVAKDGSGFENYVTGLEHRLDKKSFDLTIFAVPSVYGSPLKEVLDKLHTGSDEFVAELNKELTDAEKAVAEFDSLGKASVTVYKAECFDGDQPKTTDECFPLATGCEEDKECPNFSKCVQCNIDDDCDGDKTCNVEEGTCVDPEPPAPEVCGEDSCAEAEFKQCIIVDDKIKCVQCTADEQCTEEGETCLEDNTCGKETVPEVCGEDSCEEAEFKQCIIVDDKIKCVQCTEDEQCTEEGETCLEDNTCGVKPDPAGEFQLAQEKATGVCQKKKAANSSAVASVMVTLAMTVAMVALMIA